MKLEFRGAPLAQSRPDNRPVSLGGRILLHYDNDDVVYLSPEFELLTDAEVKRASASPTNADVSFYPEAQWRRWWEHLADGGSKSNTTLHSRLIDDSTVAALSYRAGGRWGSERVDVIVRMPDANYEMVQAWLRDAIRRGHAPRPHFWFDLVTVSIAQPRELPTWDEFLSAGWAATAPMLCTSAHLSLSYRSDMPSLSDFAYQPVEKH